MPLPVENQAWPTPEWEPAFEQYESNAAWFGADAERLAGLYGGGITRGDNPATHLNRSDGTWRRGGLKGRIYQFFVGKIVAQQTPASGPLGARTETRILSPIAGNIASMSADKVMGTPPSFRLEVSGKPVDGDRQARVDDLFSSDPMRLALANAAELAAGLSAVAITAHYGDRTTSDRPWIQVTACDAVIPEWEGSRLTAVNLWTTYPTTDAFGVLGKVYYHVERHEPGAVVHALYDGKIDGIGRRVPLDAHELTAWIQQIAGGQWNEADRILTLPTGIEELTAAWWPNRPTRRFRNDGHLSLIGRADIEGGEPFCDAHSMVWSSWLRDIKVARARLIVPNSMLETGQEGGGAFFDDDAEIITGLSYVRLGDSSDVISAQQFAIRADDHAKTLLDITREILQHAGYNLSSYGEYGGGAAVTATEVNDRTSNTAATVAKKRLAFKAAFQPLARALLALDARHYAGTPLGDATLTIEFDDSPRVDPEAQARAFSAYYAAYSASIETLVRERSPDWDDGLVKAEVERIKEERGLNRLADPTQRIDPLTGKPIILRDDDEPTEPEDDEDAPPADEDEEPTP